MADKLPIVPLDRHDRTNFSCGVEALDRYLKIQATQDMRRKVSNCFVALGREGEIVAYYTFAAANVLASDLPADVARKLPRYPYVPAALIGRLAVDKRVQGQRLGEALLADAALRAARSAPAVFALLVDAKDASAEAFYKRFGFRDLQSQSLSLFLPIATAEKAWLG